jgi:hypothetical protein
MKKKILDFIQELEEKFGIQIKINIGYQSDNNLYGSVTVGRFGFMLYQTWQPQSDTTFKFKIDGESGNVFDYETVFENHNPVNKLITYGDFKKVFFNNIIESIKACKCSSETTEEGARYENAIRKSKELYADLIR